MASRKIICQSCKSHLGEIRDARLKNGIVYLCDRCEKTRVYMVKKGAEIEKDSIDFLKDILSINS